MFKAWFDYLYTKFTRKKNGKTWEKILYHQSGKKTNKGPVMIAGLHLTVTVSSSNINYN